MNTATTVLHTDEGSLTVEAEYDYHAGERQTYWHPGADAYVEVTGVRVVERGDFDPGVIRDLDDLTRALGKGAADEVREACLLDEDERRADSWDEAHAERYER